MSPQATHGRVRAQALPNEPHVSLGRARRVHAQEPSNRMHLWVRAPRVPGGQEMTNVRSLERYPERFDLPLA